MCSTPIIDMSIEPAFALLWLKPQLPLLYSGGGLCVARYCWGGGAERGGNTIAVISIILDHSSCTYVHLTRSTRAYSLAHPLLLGM